MVFQSFRVDRIEGSALHRIAQKKRKTIVNLQPVRRSESIQAIRSDSRGTVPATGVQPAHA